MVSRESARGENENMKNNIEMEIEYPSYEEVEAGGWVYAPAAVVGAGGAGGRYIRQTEALALGASNLRKTGDNAGLVADWPQKYFVK